MTRDGLQVSIATVLLGLALAAMPWSYARAFRFWARPPRRRSALVLASAVVLAAVVRLAIAPRAIATVYIGYHLTAQAIELLPVSRYGVGAPAFYHFLFSFLPLDHRTLLFTNSVLGVLTLPLAATVAARLLGDRRAGAVFALLLALSPIFVRNDNSDANNVPALFWLLGACVLLDAYLLSRSRGALAGTVALAALAGMTRPEMLVLVPLWILTYAVVTVGPRRVARRLREPALVAAALCFAVLLVPHALHIRAQADDLKHGLTGFGPRKLLQIPDLMLHRNAVLAPRLYPVALLPLALLGTLVAPTGRGRRARLLVAVLSLLSLAVYVVDLDWANMARVHVPGALLLTVLAAGGLWTAWSRIPLAVRAAMPGAARVVIPALRLALVLAVAASMVPTARTLFAPTNEDAEESFIREALAALPPEDVTLVRLDWDDRDRSDPFSAYTHVDFPDYLFQPPNRPGHVMSVAEWNRSPDWSRPAFFYQGTRCYARFRLRDVPPPHGENLQPACAELPRAFRLDTVLRRNIPNRGDVWLEYYGDAPTLSLALYRIQPR